MSGRCNNGNFGLSNGVFPWQMEEAADKDKLHEIELY